MFLCQKAQGVALHLSLYYELRPWVNILTKKIYDGIAYISQLYVLSLKFRLTLTMYINEI